MLEKRLFTFSLRSSTINIRRILPIQITVSKGNSETHGQISSRVSFMSPVDVSRRVSGGYPRPSRSLMWGFERGSHWEMSWINFLHIVKMVIVVPIDVRVGGGGGRRQTGEDEQNELTRFRGWGWVVRV